MQTIIGICAKPLGWLLSWIYSLVGNYGIALILLTLVVKLCLYPLYAKQIKSTTNMADIQPKVQALQKKYANDKEMLNQKTMELYKEEGFNPAGGCLPMLIQMPIIFGLFALLRNPMTYIVEDHFMSADAVNNMLVAIHESFIWINDWSQPDNWVLPILAAITTFFTFMMTQQQQTSTSGAANSSAGMMKVMKYFYPIMILWMGRSFPAGLTLYWFVGQLIQILFNLRLNKLRAKAAAEAMKKKAK